MHYAKSIAFIFAVLTARSAFADWDRLPVVEVMPVNMTAGGLREAKVISSHGILRAESLLSEDAEQSVFVPTGESEVVLRLGGHYVTEVLRFMNDGIEGVAVIDTGSTTRDWTEAGRVAVPKGRRVVEASFADIAARYLRVRFSMKHGGTIRAFKLFGQPRDKDYELTPAADKAKKAKKAGKRTKGESDDVNLAGGLDEARPIYAFPAPSNLSKLEFTQNIYKFAPSSERRRTIVYDLGSEHRLKRFSTAYTLCPTRVDIFVFSQLPEKRDSTGKITLDPAIFDMIDPVATGLDEEGCGHMRHIPDEPVSARYIAVRFEPLDNPAGQSSARLPSWKAMASAALGPVGAALEVLPEFSRGRWTVWPAASVRAVAIPSGNPGVGISEATIEIADDGHRVIAKAGGTEGASFMAGGSAAPSSFGLTPASPGAATPPIPGAVQILGPTTP